MKNHCQMFFHLLHYFEKFIKCFFIVRQKVFYHPINIIPDDNRAGFHFSYFRFKLFIVRQVINQIPISGIINKI